MQNPTLFWGMIFNTLIFKGFRGFNKKKVRTNISEFQPYISGKYPLSLRGIRRVGGLETIGRQGGPLSVGIRRVGGLEILDVNACFCGHGIRRVGGLETFTTACMYCAEGIRRVGGLEMIADINSWRNGGIRRAGGLKTEGPYFRYRGSLAAVWWIKDLAIWN